MDLKNFVLLRGIVRFEVSSSLQTTSWGGCPEKSTISCMRLISLNHLFERICSDIERVHSVQKSLLLMMKDGLRLEHSISIDKAMFSVEICKYMHSLTVPYLATYKLHYLR